MSHHAVLPGAQPALLPRRGRHAHRSRSRPPHPKRWKAVSLLAAAGVAALYLVAGESWAVSPTAEEPSGGVVIDDGMARTVTGGWGTAPVGGPYEMSGAFAGSVTPGGATLTVPASGTSSSAVLGQSRALDSVTRTTVSLQQIPATGGGVYNSVLLRRQANRDSYRAKFRILPGGEVRLSFSRMAGGSEVAIGAGEGRTGLHLVPGQRLNVEVQITGTATVSLRSRVWLGGAAPDWQQVASDTGSARIVEPGATGLMTYLSSASPAPAAVTFSGLSGRVPDAPGVPGPTAPVSGAPTPAPAAPPAPGPSATPSAPGATPSATPAAPDVPSSPGTGSGSAGSVPVGSTDYAVPADAIVVSPTGNDAAAGSVGAPLRTVAKAIALAGSGRTIVLRAGTYHESVQIPANKQLTLQSFPHEQVWFDGSSAVSGWVASGSTWVKTGWTTQFDATPCYNAASCNNPDPDFQFVGADFPMAAHPDQVWIGVAKLRQVDTLAHVTSGTFFVDYPGQKLYVGSDPTGKEVRASDLVDAIWVRSAGSTVRGIGVHRYGTPIPKLGTVKAGAERVTLENMVVSDNATTGVSALSSNVTLHGVTADGNGMLGIHANYADGLRVDSVEADGNNAEHFKQAPVAGGIKITRSRGVAVVDSDFEDNLGTGTWFDESVYDITLVGNTIARNTGHGVSLELSAKAVVANNRVLRNGQIGVKVNNTSGVDIWNNTFVGNARNTIVVVQDSRLASNRSTPGHDPRQPFPDPTMTWIAGSATVSNNIFSHADSGAPCVLCVQDGTHQRTAEQMKVTSNGNVFNRSSGSSPASLVVWSVGATNRSFPNLAAFTAATGQDRASVALDGPAVVDDSGKPVVSVANTPAQPLPAAVAAKSGLNAALRQVGATG